MPATSPTPAPPPTDIDRTERPDAVSVPDIRGRDWLETHRSPFVLIDVDYTIVAANRAYADAYGTRPDAIVGRKCHDVSHRSPEPCHRRGEHCPHQVVFATGGPTDVIHVHFDARGRAERVRLSARPLHLVDGRLVMSESIQRLEVIDEAEPTPAAAMAGCSPAFQQMLMQLHDAARSDLPLLIRGETGAGKEVAAHWVHRNSARAGSPLIIIDCTAIPESLFESELFGHERGAFSGPTHRRVGLAEEASGGTLFFDEIGDLPIALQPKLLRFIETGEFRRLGSNQVRRVDCRVISATHRSIDRPGHGPDFRRDLYYRLAALDVHVPALRDRPLDIQPIAESILQSHRRRTGSPGLTPEALAQLATMPLPGNVRELRNLLLRAAQRSGSGWIGIDALQPTPVQSQPLADGLHRASAPWVGNEGGRAGESGQAGESSRTAAASPAAEADDGNMGLHIRRLCSCGLSRRAVADRLGISERTVYRHLARQGDRAAPPA